MSGHDYRNAGDTVMLDAASGPPPAYQQNASRSRSRQRPLAHFYTIGWITAKPLETHAAIQFLDEICDPPARDKLKGIELPYDKNFYVYGRMHEHYVAICELPQNQSGQVTMQATVLGFEQSFPNLKLCLLVGIGGGVPSDRFDLRLGDVVVQKPLGAHKGVVSYDYKKQYHGGKIKLNLCNGLKDPPSNVLGAVNSIFRDISSGIKDGWELETEVHENVKLQHPVRPFCDDSNGKEVLFRRPGDETDYLFNSDLENNDKYTCSGHCAIMQKKMRLHPMMKKREHHVRRHDTDRSVAHRGLIGSGTTLVRDPHFRDMIAVDPENPVDCVEMEGAALSACDIGALVIRGISDYSDSHKNDEWQGYAAAVASAFAKRVIEILPLRVYQRAFHNELEGRSMTELVATVATININAKNRNLIVDTYVLPAAEKVSSAIYDRSLEQAGKAKHAESIQSGQWLLQCDSFEQWKEPVNNGGERKEPDNAIFTLYGIAGCGKTVLSSIVVDHLSRSLRREVTEVQKPLYYFFSGASESSTAPNAITRMLSTGDRLPTGIVERMILAFISQLYRQDPGFVEDILVTRAKRINHEEGTKGLALPTFTELQDVLEELISSYKHCTFIVLDGLDECGALNGSTPSTNLMQWIKTMLKPRKYVIAGFERIMHIRLFLASQKTSLITMQLESWVPLQTERLSCSGAFIDDEHENVNQDLNNYVRDSITKSDIMKKRFGTGLESEVYLQEITAKVLDASSGMFLLASLILQELEYKCNNKTEVEDLLAQVSQSENVGSRIISFYSRIFQRIEKKREKGVIRLLQFILHLDSPLRIEEAIDILIVDPELDSEPDPKPWVSTSTTGSSLVTRSTGSIASSGAGPPRVAPKHHTSNAKKSQNIQRKDPVKPRRCRVRTEDRLSCIDSNDALVDYLDAFIFVKEIPGTRLRYVYLAHSTVREFLTEVEPSKTGDEARHLALQSALKPDLSLISNMTVCLDYLTSILGYLAAVLIYGDEESIVNFTTAENCFPLTNLAFSYWEMYRADVVIVLKNLREDDQLAGESLRKQLEPSLKRFFSGRGHLLRVLKANGFDANDLRFPRLLVDGWHYTTSRHWPNECAELGCFSHEVIADSITLLAYESHQNLMFGVPNVYFAAITGAADLSFIKETLLELEPAHDPNRWNKEAEIRLDLRVTSVQEKKFWEAVSKRAKKSDGESDVVEEAPKLDETQQKRRTKLLGDYYGVTVTTSTEVGPLAPVVPPNTTTTGAIDRRVANTNQSTGSGALGPSLQVLQEVLMVAIWAKNELLMGEIFEEFWIGNLLDSARNELVFGQPRTSDCYQMAIECASNEFLKLNSCVFDGSRAYEDDTSLVNEACLAGTVCQMVALSCYREEDLHKWLSYLITTKGVNINQIQHLSRDPDMEGRTDFPVRRRTTALERVYAVYNAEFMVKLEDLQEDDEYRPILYRDTFICLLRDYHADPTIPCYEHIEHGMLSVLSKAVVDRLSLFRYNDEDNSVTPDTDIDITEYSSVLEFEDFKWLLNAACYCTASKLKGSANKIQHKLAGKWGIEPLLHLACKVANSRMAALELVMLLVEEFGADVCHVIVNSDGEPETALEIALECGHCDVVCYLLYKGAARSFELPRPVTGRLISGTPGLGTIQTDNGRSLGYTDGSSASRTSSSSSRMRTNVLAIRESVAHPPSSSFNSSHLQPARVTSTSTTVARTGTTTRTTTHPHPQPLKAVDFYIKEQVAYNIDFQHSAERATDYTWSFFWAEYDPYVKENILSNRSYRSREYQSSERLLYQLFFCREKHMVPAMVNVLLRNSMNLSFSYVALSQALLECRGWEMIVKDLNYAVITALSVINQRNSPNCFDFNSPELVDEASGETTGIPALHYLCDQENLPDDEESEYFSISDNSNFTLEKRRIGTIRALLSGGANPYLNIAAGGTAFERAINSGCYSAFAELVGWLQKSSDQRQVKDYLKRAAELGMSLQSSNKRSFDAVDQDRESEPSAERASKIQKGLVEHMSALNVGG